MIQAISLKQDVEEILKDPNQSYEHIAAGVGVSSMTIRRWHKDDVRPKSRVVIRSFKNYKKTLVQN